MGLFLYFGLVLVSTICIIKITLSTNSAISEVMVLGYSFERLLLICFLFLFLFITIFLLYESIKVFSAKNSILIKLLSNKSTVLFIVFSSLIVCIILLFSFIVEKDFFQNYYLIYSKLELFFLWLYLITLLTFNFSLFWFCINFTGIFSSQKIAFPNKTITILVIVFLISVCIKILLINPNGFGLLREAGESNYFIALRDLKDRVFLYSADVTTKHQPFLYSLSLLPSLFIKNYSFEIIKIINSIYLSAIIFPIYLIARQLLSRKLAFVAIIVCSVLPFQFHLSIRLLSENLFLPILFWTIYLVFTSPTGRKIGVFWDILAGIFIGLLYLTRFMALPLIPIFLVNWYFKKRGESKELKKNLLSNVFNLILICLSIVLTFSPWILINLENGFTLRHSLGFSITENTNEDQLTALNLINWAILYFAYFIILSGPSLNLILFSIFSHKINDKTIRRWMLLAFSISLGFFITVVRHSWRAWYNDALPGRIMGRYVIYITPIIIITGLIWNEKITNQKTHINANIIWIFFILSICLSFISYLIILEGKVIEFSDSFIQPTISFDAFYVNNIGIWSLVLLVLIFGITTLYSFRPKLTTYTIIFPFLIAFYIVGLPKYINYFNNLQSLQKIGVQISNLMLECNQSSSELNFYSIIIPNHFSRNQKNNLFWTIGIRNLESNYRLLRSMDIEMENPIYEDDVVIRLKEYTFPSFKESEFSKHEEGYEIEILNCGVQ